MGLFCRIVFSGPAHDVSRETFLRKKGLLYPAPPAMFHVKPFSPAPFNHRRSRHDVSRETLLRKSGTSNNAPPDSKDLTAMEEDTTWPVSSPPSARSSWASA